RVVAGLSLAAQRAARVVLELFHFKRAFVHHVQHAHWLALGIIQLHAREAGLFAMALLHIAQRSIHIMVLEIDHDAIAVTGLRTNGAVGMPGALRAARSIARAEIALHATAGVEILVNGEAPLIIVALVLQRTIGVVILHPTGAGMSIALSHGIPADGDVEGFIRIEL